MPIRPSIPLPGPLVYTPSTKESSGPGLIVGCLLFLLVLAFVGAILSAAATLLLTFLLVRAGVRRFRRWRRSKMR
jgi:hypothetical protein